MRSLLFLSCVLLVCGSLCAQSSGRRSGVMFPDSGEELQFAIEHDFKLPPGVYLPRHLDLSPYFPVAGDQHKQASCTAWSLGYGLASFRNNWESNRRPDKSLPPDPEEVYSPGFLFNMVKQYVQPDTSRNTCLSGVNIGSTIDVACKWGNCRWQEYPYNSSNTGCEDPLDTTAIVIAKPHTLPQPVQIWRTNKGRGRSQNPFDAVQWKYHMARKEPLVVCFWVDCSFVLGGDSAAREGRPFIWDNIAVNDTDVCNMGHAMVCTGYDDRDSTFTFLNSFGTNWGDSGYVKITYRTLDTLAVTAAYVFSKQWWGIIPVVPGKAAQAAPVLDSTYNEKIKRGEVHRFHDMEVRVVTVSPDKQNIVVQFVDTAYTKPVLTLEFPRGVKRSFLYEDKLWSFTYFEPSRWRNWVSKELPFTLTLDCDDDEMLEEAMRQCYAPWRDCVVHP